MIYTLSLVLIFGALFHFSNNEMAKASRSISAITPTGTTGELTDEEFSYSGNGTRFHYDIAPPEYHRVTSRNAPGSTWERFHVYMGPSITDSQRDMVYRATYELSQIVCIPFGIIPVDSRPYGDYVHVTNTKQGCWANLGRLGGEQGYNFEPHCWTQSNVLHDFVHSLGIDHEHSRGDRDDYVTIHWENIIDEMKYAFKKEPWGHIPTYGVPYNPRSITHYPSWAYSKNGKPTITTKDGRQIPANEKLTYYDKELLRRMYRCR